MNPKLLQTYATARKATVLTLHENEDGTVTFVLSTGQKLTMSDSALQAFVDDAVLKARVEEAASTAALEVLTAKAKKSVVKKGD
jgi:hypothetical protein